MVLSHPVNGKGKFMLTFDDFWDPLSTPGWHLQECERSDSMPFLESRVSFDCAKILCLKAAQVVQCRHHMASLVTSLICCMQCTLYVDLVAQWCAGAGWLVMADINSNLRAEHVWAVVQDGLIPATCCHQNKWSWFSIKTPAQDCPAINRSIAMWQHGNRSGGLVWHSTLTLSGSSDCYGCRMGQANSINTYRSYSILYYDNIITINYDTWAWSCNAESFTSHSDKAGRRKAASLLRITPGLCHAEPLQDLGNLERGWSESSPRTAVDSVIVSLPLFPCPQFRLCEAYTMSIAGPHFFSTGMLWSLWMRAILRRLSWALLFRGPLAIGTTPSRTKKISWSNQARAGFFVCFRVSVCSRGPRLSNTLTQTDWGCWRCVLLLMQPVPNVLQVL